MQGKIDFIHIPFQYDEVCENVVQAPWRNFYQHNDARVYSMKDQSVIGSEIEKYSLQI